MKGGGLKESEIGVSNLYSVTAKPLFLLQRAKEVSFET